MLWITRRVRHLSRLDPVTSSRSLHSRGFTFARRRKHVSDQEEVTQARELITELLTGLKTTIVEPHPDEKKGGLFPNGVNDIYLNATIGPIKIELEVTAADHISSKPLGGVHGTTDDGHIEGCPTWEIRNYVHPMVVSNPSKTDAHFKYRLSNPSPHYTAVPYGLNDHVPIEGSSDTLVVANIDLVDKVVVYVHAYAPVPGGEAGGYPVLGNGGFWATSSH
jgi:hypothetical protein